MSARDSKRHKSLSEILEQASAIASGRAVEYSKKETQDTSPSTNIKEIHLTPHEQEEIARVFG